MSRREEQLKKLQVTAELLRYVALGLVKRLTYA